MAKTKNPETDFPRSSDFSGVRGAAEFYSAGSLVDSDFFEQASNVRRWNGSAWVGATMQRWNGSAMVPAPVRRWNGSAWISV